MAQPQPHLHPPRVPGSLPSTHPCSVIRLMSELLGFGHGATENRTPVFEAQRPHFCVARVALNDQVTGWGLCGVMQIPFRLQQILPNGTLRDLTAAAAAPYRWRSSDPTVATIHPTTGVLTGVTFGTVEVLAEDERVAGVYPLTLTRASYALAGV